MSAENDIYTNDAPSAASASGIGSGSGPTNDSVDQTTGLPPKAAQGLEQTEGIKSQQPSLTPATPAQPVTPQLDDAVIGKLAENMMSKMAGVQQKQAQAQQKGQAPQYTPEQIAALRPITVTPQMLASFGYEECTPTQVAAFQQFANGIVEHAAHIAAFVNQQMLEQAEARYAPIVSRYEEQARKEQTDTFFSANKDLEKYPRFVAAAAARVTPNNADGSSKTFDAAAKEVADITRSMLAEAGVNLSGQANASPSAVPNQGGVPTMPTLAGSGRSTSGASGKGQVNNPDAAIYL